MFSAIRRRLPPRMAVSPVMETAQPAPQTPPGPAVPNPDRPHVVIVYREGGGKVICNSPNRRGAFELAEKLMATAGATRCEIEPAWEFRPGSAA